MNIRNVMHCSHLKITPSLKNLKENDLLYNSYFLEQASYGDRFGSV